MNLLELIAVIYFAASMPSFLILWTMFLVGRNS